MKNRSEYKVAFHPRPVVFRAASLLFILAILGFASSLPSLSRVYNTEAGLPNNPRVASIISVDWNYTLGGVNEEEFTGVAVDEYNNALVCGKTRSWGMGGDDATLMKYNPGGSLVWNQTWGGSKTEQTQGIAVDSRGIASITGLVESWGEGFCDAPIAQYNSTGDRIWNDTYGINLNFIRGMGIATDRNNSIYVGGMIYPPSGDFDAFLQRWNGAGIEWSFRWNKSKQDMGQCVAVDLRNHVYLAGTTNVSGTLDAFVARFTSDGVSKWNRTWGGAGREISYGIATDEQGNIYVVGETSSYGSGGSDVFLLKYNDLGMLLWNKTWGGASDDIGYGVATDRFGNIFITGNVTSWGASEGDLFAIKCNLTGEIMWNITFGGLGAESGLGIATERHGEYVWVAGYTSSWGAGGRDGILVKLDDPQPIITQPEHQYLLLWSSTQITWGISDATSNLAARYSIYQDGIQIQSGDWMSEEQVQVIINNLHSGNNNFTLLVWDGTGDSASSTVIVTIGPPEWPLVFVIVMIIALYLFLFIGILPRTKGRRRVMLTSLFLLLIGGLTTLGLMRPPFMFSPAGRYDPSRMTLGVAFESPGDIYFFYCQFCQALPCIPTGCVHEGLHYDLRNNSVVLAAANGQVTAIQLAESEAENAAVNRYYVQVFIRFNSTLFFKYNMEAWTNDSVQQQLQFSLIKVRVGDWVVKGQPIATFLKCNSGAHICFRVEQQGETNGQSCPTKHMGPSDLATLEDMIHCFQPTWDVCYPPP